VRPDEEHLRRIKQLERALGRSAQIYSQSNPSNDGTKHLVNLSFSVPFQGNHNK